MDDLDRLSQVVEAMTAGPWKATPSREVPDTWVSEAIGGHRTIACCTGMNGHPGCIDDAHGIVALRNIAPELIAVARAGRRVSAHVLHEPDLGAHQDHEAALVRLRAKLKGAR